MNYNYFACNCVYKCNHVYNNSLVTVYTWLTASSFLVSSKITDTTNGIAVLLVPLDKILCLFDKSKYVQLIIKCQR